MFFAKSCLNEDPELFFVRKTNIKFELNSPQTPWIYEVSVESINIWTRYGKMLNVRCFIKILHYAQCDGNESEREATFFFLIKITHFFRTNFLIKLILMAILPPNQSCTIITHDESLMIIKSFFIRSNTCMPTFIFSSQSNARNLSNWNRHLFICACVCTCKAYTDLMNINRISLTLSYLIYVRSGNLTWNEKY